MCVDFHGVQCFVYLRHNTEDQDEVSATLMPDSNLILFGSVNAIRDLSPSSQFIIVLPLTKLPDKRREVLRQFFYLLTVPMQIRQEMHQPFDAT